MRYFGFVEPRGSVTLVRKFNGEISHQQVCLVWLAVTSRFKVGPLLTSQVGRVHLDVC